VFGAIEKLGMRIAINDFGTGYSSLSYLQRLPAKILKIDRSFVRALDSGGVPIIGAGISLARAFGMKVVAEGVETYAQWDAMARLGVDFVQGFLPGSPQSEQDVRIRLVSDEFSTPNNSMSVRIAAGGVPG
jgi:diguanylate cyclase